MTVSNDHLSRTAGTLAALTPFIQRASRGVSEHSLARAPRRRVSASGSRPQRCAQPPIAADESTTKGDA